MFANPVTFRSPATVPRVALLGIVCGGILIAGGAAAQPAHATCVVQSVTEVDNDLAGRYAVGSRVHTRDEVAALAVLRDNLDEISYGLRRLNR